ncbi:hypothetical protein EV401DRAFT_1131522 [Pisolithus croceorrhizus]|nr:hypothetical protein EV401DRAFT_1131522 [Pisolithus croceorrhizus]
MFPGREFSTLLPTPVESGTPACHLHGDSACNLCSLPSEDSLGEPGLPPDGSLFDDLLPEPWYLSDMLPMFAPPASHVNYSETAAILGHKNGVQSTTNYYNMPLEPFCPPNAGFSAPTQFVPSMESVQATGFNTSIGYPTFAQGYVGQFGSDASTVTTSGTSVDTLSSTNLASSPSEVSQAHTLPAQLAVSAPPQVLSQFSGDRRPCQWRNNQGGICGELVGRHCQDHLALEHGIVNMSSSRSIECGACGEEKKRKFFLRHFREVHLGFSRGT